MKLLGSFLFGMAFALVSAFMIFKGDIEWAGVQKDALTTCLVERGQYKKGHEQCLAGSKTLQESNQQLAHQLATADSTILNIRTTHALVNKMREDFEKAKNQCTEDLMLARGEVANLSDWKAVHEKRVGELTEALTRCETPKPKKTLFKKPAPKRSVSKICTHGE